MAKKYINETQLKNIISKQVKKYLTIVLGRTVDLLIDNYSYINYSDNALKEREVIFDDSK